MSVLENYYDRTRADEWDAVFEGTDAGRKPTDDRSRYVILRFNFSAFDDTLDGEKVVQAFLAVHFSLASHFLIRSERELNKGYADLHLEPFLARYPDVRYGYVIELKYLRRGEAADGTRWPPGCGRRGRSCAAIWPTRACAASGRRCGTSAWRWCSTAGNWRPARRWTTRTPAADRRPRAARAERAMPGKAAPRRRPRRPGSPAASQTRLPAPPSVPAASQGTGRHAGRGQ